METFFGGNPVVVFVRLVVLSLIVGVLLSALGLSPYDIVDSIRQLIQRIYDLGFASIEWLVRYFLLGAIIVFPIWLVQRLFRASSRGGRPPSEYRSTSREL